MTATALFQRPHWGVNGWRARSETDQRDVSPLEKWRHNATRHTYSCSLYFVRYLLTPTRSTRISRMPIANRPDAFEFSQVTHLPHSVKCPSANPESLFAATKYLTRRFGTRKFSDAERWCNPRGGMLPDSNSPFIRKGLRICDGTYTIPYISDSLVYIRRCHQIFLFEEAGLIDENNE